MRGGETKALTREASASSSTAPARYTQVAAVTLIGVCLVCGLYYVYRYPFRISDPSTSPTYGSTPTWLQVGKYVLLAAIQLPVIAWGMWVVLTRRARLTRRELLLAVLALYAAGRASAAGLAGGGHNALDVVAPVVSVVPIALAVALGAGPDWPRRVGRICLVAASALLLAHALANVAEILMWHITGRLPALAYRVGLKRFGGVWDDPNSTAGFSAAFLVFLACRRVRMAAPLAAALVAAAILNVAVAVAYSAVLGVAAGLAVLFIVRRPHVVRNLVILLVAAVLLVPAAPHVVDLLAHIPGLGLSSKRESFSERLHLRTYIASPGSPAGWIFGATRSHQFEDAYGDWLLATGIVGLALLLGLIVWSVYSVRRSREFGWAAPTVVAVAVPSIFIPHLAIFPIAAIFLLSLSIPASFMERERERATASRSIRQRARGRRPGDIWRARVRGARR